MPTAGPAEPGASWALNLLAALHEGGNRRKGGCEATRIGASAAMVQLYRLESAIG